MSGKLLFDLSHTQIWLNEFTGIYLMFPIIFIANDKNEVGAREFNSVTNVNIKI